MLVFLSLAWGADLSGRPLRAEVQLAPGGVSAIRVPLGLRWGGEPSDGSDLLLVDAVGNEVPFAIVKGGSANTPVTVDFRPTADTGVYEVTPLESIDGLTVQVPWGSSASVTVTDGGATLGAGMVWAREGSNQQDISLSSSTRSLLRLTVRTVEGDGLGLPTVTGWRKGTSVPQERVDATVLPLYVAEDGTAWTAVTLPQTLPIRRLVPTISEPVFDRQAVVVDGLDPRGQTSTGGRLFRSTQGGTPVEELGLSPSTTGTSLLIGVRPDRGGALSITGAHVEVDGEWLIVRDPGQGPFVLYGGPSGLAHGTWDLQAQAEDLARTRPPVVDAAPVSPNPAWTPPEVAARLLEPGPQLQIARYKWQRPVLGAGLVRVDIPDDVMAASVNDLADVRVVDQDDRQIPYRLVRTVGAALPLQFTREEVGSRSVIRATIPENLPIETVILATDAPVFSRQVRVGRPGATGMQDVRAVDWSADGTPLPRGVDVQTRLGDTLLIEIDNGNDAPLPVTGLSFVAQRWSLITAVPPQGARLVYGDWLGTASDYDLSLLGADIERRPPSAATLGPQEAVVHPGLSWWDFGLILLGLAVTMVGLLVVTVRLVLAAPAAPADPPKEPVKDDKSPAPPPPAAPDPAPAPVDIPAEIQPDGPTEEIPPPKHGE